MLQPEGTTLWGQAQRRILPASELKNVPKCGEGVKGKKRWLKTVALAVSCDGKAQKIQNESVANHSGVS